MNIFLDWNLLLDQVGGPNHVKNYCDAPFLFHTEKEKPTQQEIQTYLNHFSHNIQPGAVRIGFSRYTDKIELTAFRKDSTIIVILLNRTEEELPAYLRLHDQCAKITVAPRSIASAVISDCVPVLSPWQRLS